jgi:Leucine-rich repeat (LRR) protein
MEFLSSLVNLRYLHLTYFKDRYFRELLPLQNLEVLILSGLYPVNLDFTYIAQLYSLRELSISDGSPFHNIEELRNLVNLEKINIWGISSNISWITPLQKLEEVDFSYSKINDISPLLELPNLSSVLLYRTEVKDISPLLESKSIKIIVDFITEEASSELYSLFRERGIEIMPFSSDR